ncbi:MAG: nucleotidyltransferase family protein [Firmicutes bacterium]|nr:nucleotidyltransferase family protein [Bacillota bacterium]
MTQAVILAGGYSKRTGINKMSLIYQGIPLIHHVIEAFLPVTENIIVVSGHYHEELKSILRKYGTVQIVQNFDYPNGMFSSVQRGVQETSEDFFVTPGDYPLIKTETIQKMLEAKGPIVVPVFEGRKGHPILFRKELKQPLLEEEPNSNLKVFRDRYTPEYIQVNDPGILKDIDTIADYEDLIEGKE